MIRKCPLLVRVRQWFLQVVNAQRSAPTGRVYNFFLLKMFFFWPEHTKVTVLNGAMHLAQHFSCTVSIYIMWNIFNHGVEVLTRETNIGYGIRFFRKSLKGTFLYKIYFQGKIKDHAQVFQGQSCGNFPKTFLTKLVGNVCFI